MLRIVFLIAPVFVCLFWVVVLADNPKSQSIPRSFFGKFMFLPLIVYFTHFLYFAPFPQIYPYFDAAFCYSSLLVFPMYYVYFRLLTVDQKFSLKVHGKYFVPALIVGSIYTIAVIIAPQKEYRAWLYNQNAYDANLYIKFLSISRMLGKFTYLIQVVVVVISNYFLIKKYGDRAEQFYSEILDGKNNYATSLNLSFVLLSIAAIVFAAMGRYIIEQSDYYVIIGWSAFSVMLFIIGYLGFKLKPFDPTFEVINEIEDQNQFSEITPIVQKRILNKLEEEFIQKRIYLNSQLNIMDVVESVGTNRTYISLIINQKYHQNFCSFVNGFRVEELKKVYLSNPDFTNEALAHCCGFGSVNSMKRAVTAKTGMSMSDFKMKIRK
ncbi:MAG: hypothetical protein PHH37_00425 [Paludibacter sp.]|nr:hypothetical protein [Paludibacter sp.]